MPALKHCSKYNWEPTWIISLVGTFCFLFHLCFLQPFLVFLKDFRRLGSNSYLCRHELLKLVPVPAPSCFLEGKKEGRPLHLTFLTALRGCISHLPPGFVFCLPSLLPSIFAPSLLVPPWHLAFKELFLGQPSTLCSHPTRVQWAFALNTLPFFYWKCLCAVGFPGLMAFLLHNFPSAFLPSFPWSRSSPAPLQWCTGPLCFHGNSVLGFLGTPALLHCYSPGCRPNFCGKAPPPFF